MLTTCRPITWTARVLDFSDGRCRPVFKTRLMRGVHAGQTARHVTRFLYVRLLRANLADARSGAFAVVYKAIPAGQGRPIAVRTFSSESPERQERYNCIGRYLGSAA